MGEPKGISYFLKSTTTEEKFVDIYTVPGGKRFHAKVIRVEFPSGTGGELQVALYYGLRKVAPATPYYNGDDARFEDCIDVLYHSGDPVRLWYKNTVAALRKANVKVEGILE